MGPRLVVLDLDGTVCRLDVDWGALRARLAAIAARAGILPAGHHCGVLAIVEAAHRSGHAFVARELEWTLGAAELAGAGRCEVNEALLEWLGREAAAAELSVLSLNSPAAVERALARAGLGRRMGWVVGRGDARPKPDPQGLELLLARHGVDAGDALFVGDSVSDQACASSAGVRFRHVSELGIRWYRPGVDAAA
jgi:phosphoglycolate phosphatase